VGVPQGWTDDGTYLTAPNGKTVVLGFRWHILTHPWAPDNWPIENEHYESVLDITNPQQGDGMVQHFRMSVLAWHEESARVLDLWSGAIALAWQRKAQATAHAVIAAPPPPPPTGKFAYHASGRQSEPAARLLRNTGPNTDRLASLEKQVQVLSRHFASPRFLVGWMLMLVALLSCDILAWAISLQINHHSTLPLPLLALGTLALCSLFFMLSIWHPRSET
jgi:hypothetical protein